MDVIPEGWVVLKITEMGDTQPVYKIFCSWRSGDRWRLSSGSHTLLDAQLGGEDLVWPQVSGTVYRLAKSGYGGMTGYTGVIFDGMMADAEAGGAKVEQLDPFQVLDKIKLEQGQTN